MKSHRDSNPCGFFGSKLFWVYPQKYKSFAKVMDFLSLAKLYFSGLN